jgi:hypothetical protein
LLLANYKDGKARHGYKLIDVKRGQHLTSELKLADRWKWSRGKVRRFLDLLSNDDMIHKLVQDRQFIIIEIVNYELYQNVSSCGTTQDIDNTNEDGICDTTDDTSNGQRTNNEQTTFEQRTDINNKDNKDNNENNVNKGDDINKKNPPESPSEGEKKNTHISAPDNNITKTKKNNTTNFDNIIKSYTENLELAKSIIDFIGMRKANKKVMTDKALQLMLGKLSKLASNDTEKIAIVNQSIEYSWLSVFPLHQENNNSNSQTKKPGNYSNQRKYNADDLEEKLLDHSAEQQEGITQEEFNNMDEKTKERYKKLGLAPEGV